ncbi:alpha/beta fold hydrolase [Convivina praedatoris]|uniref:AB hydrolase superfamily protein YdjP n=1 Tax=Convivina praedatoris TaxID=2880963 RepID=A0ABM9CZL8_9LACO|nr:alpha/beta hydrolase [Convivina sp. LMG 32447]CAH1849943.1 AB hydrolase superfamily protein YdjP [Convivina sp. LMG 32447]CAH1849947.1 AB hydrolase superfamily protein YdjP [Convivina sp. LMG 32447]CAH1851294.1 AB hydrolase superfamily protein YdjP [Convivina sp. LMG 32447]
MSYFLTSDQVKINYQISGAYDGQSLVFSTGFGANQANWQLQVDYFTTAGYRVITYDHRNQGLSQVALEDLTIKRQGQDLKELIDYCHLINPVLIGHSLGASTVWSYLSQFGQENISAVVTEDLPPKCIRSLDWPIGLFDANQEDLAVAIEKLRHQSLTYRPLPHELQVFLAQKATPFNWMANVPLLLDSLPQDWRPVAQQEELPHLVVTGQYSPLWPADQGQLTVALLTKGVLAMISETGHVPHLENPVDFNTSLANFLQKYL